MQVILLILLILAGIYCSDVEPTISLEDIAEDYTIRIPVFDDLVNKEISKLQSNPNIFDSYSRNEEKFIPNEELYTFSPGTYQSQDSNPFGIVITCILFVILFAIGIGMRIFCWLVIRKHCCPMEPAQIVILVNDDQNDATHRSQMLSDRPPRYQYN